MPISWTYLQGHAKRPERAKPAPWPHDEHLWQNLLLEIPAILSLSD